MPITQVVSSDVSKIRGLVECCQKNNNDKPFNCKWVCLTRNKIYSLDMSFSYNKHYLYYFKINNLELKNSSRHCLKV